MLENEIIDHRVQHVEKRDLNEVAVSFVHLPTFGHIVDEANKRRRSYVVQYGVKWLDVFGISYVAMEVDTFCGVDKSQCRVSSDSKFLEF